MSTPPKRPDFSNVSSTVETTAKEVPKADFGNVTSTVASTAPVVEPPPPVTYTVKKGDTLSKIAKTHLGSANKWKLIWEANQDQIKNPDLIKPGQVLKIPSP
jgi:nucleoid-associated protein YgaU